MPAWEHYDFVIQVVFLELLDHLFGKFRQERHVVLRIDDERPSRPTRKLIEVHRGTDGAPHLPKILQIDGRFQPLTDVARGLPMPHHVGKVSRGMVESSHLYPRIVRPGDKPIARSAARGDHPPPVVTLPFEPVETAA